MDERRELPELTEIIREATQHVEDELAIEDKGWITSTSYGNVVSDSARVQGIWDSRLYYAKDPLAKQSIRLWTDYTFGTGITWACEDDKASAVLEAFWDSPANQSVLSSRGQRKCSDKLLVEGECFFAMFMGKEVKIRLIDPLEITEIITDPDDRDNARYYRRDWSDTQGRTHTDYYASHLNPKNESCKDSVGQGVQATANAKDVLVYHLPYNTIGQRGLPLLLPAIDWIRQYRRFLASRVAIMLSLARFAWKTKLQGGATSVAMAKTLLNDVEVPAGSVMVENMGADTQPIRTDSGASSAYQDGRMLKLQVAAAVGIPEQYFGDISIGNLATAKTVELPMMKMFQSYQAIWEGAFIEINNLVLSKNGIDPNKISVDIDFPRIAPEDVIAIATALSLILPSMPQITDVRDVMQVALMSLGINNTAVILDQIDKNKGVPMDQTETARLIVKNLKAIREVLKTNKE